MSRFEQKSPPGVSRVTCGHASYTTSKFRARRAGSKPDTARAAARLLQRPLQVVRERRRRLRRQKPRARAPRRSCSPPAAMSALGSSAAWFDAEGARGRAAASRARAPPRARVHATPAADACARAYTRDGQFAAGAARGGAARRTDREQAQRRARDASRSRRAASSRAARNARARVRRAERRRAAAGHGDVVLDDLRDGLGDRRGRVAVRAAGEGHARLDRRARARRGRAATPTATGRAPRAPARSATAPGSVLSQRSSRRAPAALGPGAP